MFREQTLKHPKNRRERAMAGTLYLCATPIGNLEDITFRVLRTLKEVDLIAAEDTRHSIKLLNHFDIKTPMTSYHEYNKVDKARYLVGRLEEGSPPYPVRQRVSRPSPCRGFPPGDSALRPFFPLRRGIKRSVPESWRS